MRVGLNAKLAQILSKLLCVVLTNHTAYIAIKTHASLSKTLHF